MFDYELLTIEESRWQREALAYDMRRLDMTLHDCYRAVIAAARQARPEALIQYAALYAEQGLRMKDASEYVEPDWDQKVQAQYTLSNLMYWRGDEAKRVKAEMRLITKGR